MPLVWQIYCVSLLPQSVLERSMAQLRPLGLVPAWQKVVARFLLQARPEDLQPHAMTAYASRRTSDIPLVAMPLRLLVGRYRELGRALALPGHRTTHACRIGG